MVTVWDCKLLLGPLRVDLWIPGGFFFTRGKFVSRRCRKDCSQVLAALKNSTRVKKFLFGLKMKKKKFTEKEIS